MLDFEQARKNMVDCQIEPAGVVKGPVLDSFARIPREKFVPEHLKGVAYLDEDLMIKPGRFLMEPSVHARMLQACDLGPDDVLLDLSPCCGYSAAVASPLVSAVITVDKQKHAEEELNEATAIDQIWENLKCNNIVPVEGKLNQGCTEHAPYNVIVIAGSISEVPKVILDQLADEGRLVCVLKDPAEQTGEVCLYKKTGDNISSVPLFSAGTAPIHGFEVKKEFVF